MDTPDPLESTRALWTSGDYATVGDLFAAAGEGLIAHLDVAGCDVLDVACGTGNTTLAAARAGATRVVGVDLTPALLAEAAARATAAGLADRVEWREADMAHLPVPDASFDRVVSTFGAMFANDQQQVAGELLRACRPGGVVGVTAWAIDSLFGQITDVLLAVFLEPPEPAPGPRDWADPIYLPEIFGVPEDALRGEERAVEWIVPSAEAAVDLLARAAGPIIAARVALGERWPDARAMVVHVVEQSGTPTDDGRLRLELGYRMTTLVKG
ncbi:MAG TPA: class I SAM-dependent methyltransferase [Acidimicrobiales bacterium]|nr:class I SAM-dependent methyltransferase [Acidimicrobiales bacterium]